MIRASLYVADFAISNCKLELKRGIAGGVMREGVQVRDGFFHEMFARPRRSVKFCDFIVELEHRGVCELPRLGKSSRGPHSFSLRDAGLPARRDDASDKRDHYNSRCDHHSFVTLDALPGALGHGGVPRDHSHSLEMTANVFRKLLN